MYVCNSNISNDDTRLENTGFNDCGVITILGMEFKKNSEGNGCVEL
jgi:hypothetical protein